MPDKLLNYTSDIDAGKSIARIEEKLARNGARQIMKTYDAGNCVGIAFIMEVSGRLVPFKLEAKIEQCYDKLLSMRSRHTRQVKNTCRKQASKTAWKILSDWVDVQIAMVELEQADLVQIFLSFVYDTKKDKTFYQTLQDDGMKFLPPPATA